MSDFFTKKSDISVNFIKNEDNSQNMTSLLSSIPLMEYTLHKPS